MSSRSTTNGGLLATLLHESKSFPLRQLLLAAISLWLLCSSPPCLVASAPSDVVVFLSDDHCQLDCSPYEEVWIHTPNMQRLAESGLAFTRAYVASPSCAPSRVALLTGLMPARNGAEAIGRMCHGSRRILVTIRTGCCCPLAASTLRKSEHGPVFSRKSYEAIIPGDWKLCKMTSSVRWNCTISMTTHWNTII